MLEIATPLILTMTLLRVRGVKLGVANHGFPQRKEMVIERESVTFPEIMVEDINKSAYEILRPLFDMLWQSCGYERCFHYDEEGNWSNPS